MKRAFLIALAVASFACGKSLAQLGTFECARDGSCPDGYQCARQVGGPDVCVVSFPCDLTNANNNSPHGPQCPGGRCTVLTTPDAGLISACAPTIEQPLQKGASCTLPHVVGGIDQCKRGLLCYSPSREAVDGGCQQFCIDDSGCADEEFCAALYAAAGFNLPAESPGGSGTTTLFGLCVPRCSPLGPNTCGSGTNCEPMGELKNQSPPPNGMTCQQYDTADGSEGDPGTTAQSCNQSLSLFCAIGADGGNACRTPCTDNAQCEGNDPSILCDKQESSIILSGGSSLGFCN